MLRKNAFATFVLVALFSLLAVSCQPKEDNQPEEATLTLSAQSLMMDNQAQTPTTPQITYETNQAKVVVSAPAEWLDATVEGSGILIKAMANEKGRERKGEVLVFAGGAMDKITVTQSAADIVLEVSPESKTITNTGEELFVSVTSNSDRWEIEPSSYDWIQVERFTADLIKVIVLPNTESGAREGQLFAKLGTVTKQIDITQVGVGNVKYMLPLLKRQPSQFEMMDYEAKQGNYFVSFSGALPSWGIYDEDYTYAYASPVFESVVYTKDVSKAAVTKIVMYSLDGASLKSEEFYTFLRDKGFKMGPISETGGFEATHDESSFKVTAVVSEDKNIYSTLTFVPVVKQDKEYPSFSKFPFDKSNLLNNETWPSAKIIEMEKSEKSKVELSYSEKHPDLLTLIRADREESSDREAPIIRLYFIGADEENGTTSDLAEEMLVIWKDHTLGAWMDGNSFVLTNEFKTLLAQSGFEFFRESGGNTFYYNNEKKLMVVPRGGMFTDVLDGAPIFAISYFNFDADETSMNDNNTNDKLLERLAAHDATLCSKK